jgi:N-acetylglucosamine kinase-like BadF-type ATPase
VSRGPLLGVDAGGTGTRAVLTRDGEIVERREIGPLNVILHADAVDRLAALIAECRPAAAGLGLPGIRGDADAERIAATLRDRTGISVTVRDDAEVALLGAFCGGQGAIVIAGTGSAALGRAASGEGRRVGGHGYLLGDEGGGYWIGREAVRAALRASDGTGPPTALVEIVRAAFGCDLAEVVRQVHAHPAERRLLARLVPAIATSADPVAAEILDRAADHLAELASAVRAGLGPLPVAMVGGVFEVAALRSAFVAATGAVEALGPPEVGAALLAGSPIPPIPYEEEAECS